MKLKRNITKLFDDIYLKSDGLYHMTDNGEKKISREIGISSLEVNIDNDSMKSRLYFNNSIEKKYLVVNREEYLNPTNLMKYQKYGLDVMRQNAQLISNHLRNQEDEAQKIYKHSNLGFGMYQNNLIYRLYNCVGLESEYEGSFELKPKGSKEIWMQMFREEVLGQIPLELITVMGLSSTVLGFIGEELALDSNIVHIYGNSTSGKSTALKLITSMFGSPDVKKNGLFSTFNITENAMMKKLTGITGVPVSFDEISMSSIVNFTQTVYKLSAGQDKGRLNKEIEQRETESWLTTIFTNGEKSLIHSSNRNPGIQMRVIELMNIEWTKDAINSRNINTVILENYGHVGFDFVEFMMEQGKEKVKSLYYKNINTIKRVFEKQSLKDQFTDRRINIFAVILTSANIFEDMTRIKSNKTEMMKMLMKVEKESIKNRNFDKSIIEYLSEYVTANSSRFKKVGDTANYNGRDILGTIKDKENYTEIVVLTGKFDEIIKEGGFEDKSILLAELKRKKMLSCDKDRFTRKRILENGITVAVYVIKLPKN